MISSPNPFTTLQEAAPSCAPLDPLATAGVGGPSGKILARCAAPSSTPAPGTSGLAAPVLSIWVWAVVGKGGWGEAAA